MPREYLPYAVIETAFIFTDHRYLSLPPSAKLIFLTLWCRAFNERRSTLPPHVASPSSTARDTRIDRRTVSKYVQLLHDRGLTILHKDGSITIPGVRGKSNLRWKDDPSEGETPAPEDDGEGGKPKTQTRQEGEGGMGNGDGEGELATSAPAGAGGKPAPGELFPPQKKVKKSRSKKRFVPPAPVDVDTYAATINFPIDGAHFCDYYAAQGWRLKSGRPMSDWKAAVRNWKRLEEKRAKEGGHPPWENGMARASDYTNESAEDKAKRRRKTDEHNRRVRKKIEDEERREKEKLAAGATTDAD